MWVASLHFLYVVFGSICRTFASFHFVVFFIWANFEFSSKPWVKFYIYICICSIMHSSKGLLVWCNIATLTWNFTHCFICWGSVISPVFISVPRSVCLVLKIVPTLNQLSVCLNFSEIPVAYEIMIVPWYVVSEDNDCFLMAL